MDHHHDHAAHMMLDCNGQGFGGVGGSWIGHFAPGLLMLLWGIHWTTAIFWPVANGNRHAAKASHHIIMLREPLGLHMESWAKLVLPPLAMSLELWLGHPEYQRLLCPQGTSRAGHLVADNLNNWGHATMYPGFILSGLVDLIGLKVELPAGTSNFFLGFAFLIDAFVMGSHTKHQPLDQAVHQMLFLAMLVTALFVWAEAVQPQAFLLSAGRCFGILLQGTWFMAITRIMFEGRPAWQDQNPTDMAPSMFAPILFCWHMMGVTFGLFMAYVLMALWAARTSPLSKPSRLISGRHPTSLKLPEAASLLTSKAGGAHVLPVSLPSPASSVDDSEDGRVSVTVARARDHVN